MMRISVDLPAPSGGPGRPADQPRNSKSTWREVANFSNTACAINQLSGNMALPREGEGRRQKINKNRRKSALLLRD
jgi:hypothetical protein